MKIVCFMSTLMNHARNLGQARLSGDPVKVAAAEAAHDSYRDMCLAADELVVDIPWSTR